MKIRCVRCGVTPFTPAGSGFRAEFDLLKLTERKTNDGRTKRCAPAGEGEGEGERFSSPRRGETIAERCTVTEASP
jgi:hypothetical protein